MQEKSDAQLLRAYVKNADEGAFREIVTRHTDLIYSSALRRVTSPDLARDVTQNVFSDLARKAQALSAKLQPNGSLAGWLYRGTRFAALTHLRDDRRRLAHERQAMEHCLTDSESAPEWDRIRPFLDQAMDQLSDEDREALLLRYFKQQDLRAVGLALGVSEDAAQKRGRRAVERLREFFADRGVSVGASGLVGAISANAIQAAPVGLAAIVCGTALSVLSIAESAGTGATAGLVGALLQLSKAKLAVGLAATALVGVTTFLIFRSPPGAGKIGATDLQQITEPNAEQSRKAASAIRTDSAGVEEREPDPLNLLQTVARARERVTSGSMEFQVSTEYSGGGQFVRGPRTNPLRLVALFDGPKLRFEQFGREYSYTYSANEAEAEEIRKRADSMEREAAVQAGLLKPFESHHTVAYDGTVLLDYWENDGKPNGATINDPNKGTSTFIFDPRCLGLGTSVSLRGSVENYLAHSEAKSLSLVGKELVDGIPAWHVRVQSKYDQSLDFWIEAARPDRLLKHAHGSNVAISKYDEGIPRDPIPTEVTTMELRNGAPFLNIRFVRSNSQFNQPVDPSSFTLAGLNMAVGTAVSDVRNHRGIGFWTGAELSEYPPEKRAAEAQPPPKLTELLALLDFDPASLQALDAATWILLNTPDGSEVQKAAEVILKEHTRNTNLINLCKELERLRHRCSKPLLEAVLKDNPSAEVRGTAGFFLAMLLKDEAKYGENKKATVEAEKLFERVIAEYSQVKQRGFPLEHLAKPELSELRRLTVGHPAPEIEGADLDGQQMKLSDYRGKVVVLTFWWPGYYEASDHAKLVKRMAGKPFAFLGVYGDDDLTRAKADIENHGITWPSFWDKRDGPIAKAWNVRSWPSIWILDRKGVIRHRGLRGRELNDAVEALLRE